MASSFTEKTPPAFDRKTDNYEKWKQRFKIWQSITDVNKTKQGGLLVLRLDDDTQDAILELTTADEIKAEEGVTTILGHLDNIFQVDESISAYEAYEVFDSYCRPAELSTTVENFNDCMPK